MLLLLLDEAKYMILLSYSIFLIITIIKIERCYNQKRNFPLLLKKLVTIKREKRKG